MDVITYPRLNPDASLVNLCHAPMCQPRLGLAVRQVPEVFMVDLHN